MASCFGKRPIFGVNVKKILVGCLFVIMASSAFAQKTYVDPNLRTKRGLLDQEDTKTPAADKKEGSAESAKSIESDPVKKRYCACFNSKRLSEKRKDLADNLYSNNVINSEEFKVIDYYGDVVRKTSLLKKYTLSLDIETDEIECELTEVSARKPKDFKKPLEELDSVCKFDEIDRKKI